MREELHMSVKQAPPVVDVVALESRARRMPARPAR